MGWRRLEIYRHDGLLRNISIDTSALITLSTITDWRSHRNGLEGIANAKGNAVS
jgi:hypothetical protein